MVVGMQLCDEERRRIQRRKADNLTTRLCFASCPSIFGTQMMIVKRQVIYDVLKVGG
jgi:hypothetical protein